MSDSFYVSSGLTNMNIWWGHPSSEHHSSEKKFGEWRNFHNYYKLFQSTTCNAKMLPLIDYQTDKKVLTRTELQKEIVQYTLYQK